MIRPVTFVSFALALSSGAWMFVVKHQARQLDGQIGAVTAQIRSAEQSVRVLRAEWALENDPNRLGQLAAMFLPGLKPMAPDQLVTWAQLADRLPPPGSPAPGEATSPGSSGLPLPPPLPDQTPGATSSGLVASAEVPAVSSQMVAETTPSSTQHASTQAASTQLAAARPATVTRTPAPAVRRVALQVARPATHVQVPQHSAHHTAPAYSYAVPASRSVGRSVGQSVLAPRHEVHPMGARVMTITARSAPVRPAVSRPEPMGAPTAFQPTHQSVFGSYAANLPPPRPAGGTVP
ncbi:MAG TPA: hypothetical protein VF286_04095 [Acidiphilium sp.]